MEKIAAKILDMLDDVRYNRYDIDYIGWQLIYQSPPHMRKRVAFLAESISHYHNETAKAEENEQYTLF